MNTHYKLWNWWVLLNLLCLLLTAKAKKGIRSLSLKIEPEWVRRGESVTLFCDYIMESGTPYSVKWYRGTLEFYRYTPSENPPAKIFPFSEIRVDQSASNETHVTLRNVGFTLSGNFSCEVTADKSFYTSMAAAVLMVVELPSAPPVLWTDNKRYSAGDILYANCTTSPSRPASILSFQLNSLSVGDTPTVYQPFKDGLQWATRSLYMPVLPAHFQNGGMLTLRCVAEIPPTYIKVTELQLGVPGKDPIPERVHAVYPGSCATLKISKVLQIFLILLVVVSSMLSR